MPITINGSNDGARDGSDDRPEGRDAESRGPVATSWVASTLWRSVADLAAPADWQRNKFGADYPFVADELVLEFAHWAALARSELVPDWSNRLTAALDRLQDQLSAMSQDGPLYRPGLWNAEALVLDPAWRRVRQLAEELLIERDRADGARVDEPEPRVEGPPEAR